MHYFYLVSGMPEQQPSYLEEKGILLPTSLIQYMKPTIEWIEFYDPANKQACTIFDSQSWAVLTKSSAWTAHRIWKAWADLLFSCPTSHTLALNGMNLDHDIVGNHLQLLASYANIVNYFENQYIVHIKKA